MTEGQAGIYRLAANLEKENEKLYLEIDQLRKAIFSTREHSCKVQAEWFKLRKDKERLDWLLENFSFIREYDDDPVDLYTREEIDAAMKEEA